MDMRIMPLTIKILLESNSVKSRILVRRLVVAVARHGSPRGAWIHVPANHGFRLQQQPPVTRLTPCCHVCVGATGTSGYTLHPEPTRWSGATCAQCPRAAAGHHREHQLRLHPGGRRVLANGGVSTQP